MASKADAWLEPIGTRTLKNLRASRLRKGRLPSYINEDIPGDTVTKTQVVPLPAVDWPIVGVDDPPCGNEDNASRCVTATIVVPPHCVITQVSTDLILADGGHPGGWSRLNQRPPVVNDATGEITISVEGKSWSMDLDMKVFLAVTYVEYDV